MLALGFFFALGVSFGFFAFGLSGISSPNIRVRCESSSSSGGDVAAGRFFGVAAAGRFIVDLAFGWQAVFALAFAAVFGFAFALVLGDALAFAFIGLGTLTGASSEACNRKNDENVNDQVADNDK